MVEGYTESNQNDMSASKKVMMNGEQRWRARKRVFFVFWAFGPDQTNIKLSQSPFRGISFKSHDLGALKTSSAPQWQCKAFGVHNVHTSRNWSIWALLMAKSSSERS